MKLLTRYYWTIQYKNPHLADDSGVSRQFLATLPRLERRSDVPGWFTDLCDSLGDKFCIGFNYTVVDGSKWDPEKKLRNRRKRLRMRLERDYPLFADQMFKDETVRAYYNDADAR